MAQVQAPKREVIFVNACGADVTITLSNAPPFPLAAGESKTRTFAGHVFVTAWDGLVNAGWGDDVRHNHKIRVVYKDGSLTLRPQLTANIRDDVEDPDDL